MKDHDKPCTHSEFFQQSDVGNWTCSGCGVTLTPAEHLLLIETRKVKWKLNIILDKLGYKSSD